MLIIVTLSHFNQILQLNLITITIYNLNLILKIIFKSKKVKNISINKPILALGVEGQVGGLTPYTEVYS